MDSHTLRSRLSGKYKLVGKTKFRYLNDEEIEKYGFNKGKKINGLKKAVIQLSLSGEYIKTYPSIRAALTALGKSPNSQGINQCLSGQYDTAFGYRWKYRDYENVARVRKKKIYIYSYDKNGKLVKRYGSVKEAATELGFKDSNSRNIFCFAHFLKRYLRVI